MATSISSPTGASRPRQNWVLGPVSDHLLIIAAPILGLVWGVATFNIFGGGLNGQLAVLGIFMVFNVAHHFPTFIRIYGDADLMKRFRWSLLLAPIIPFTASLLLCSSLVLKGFPIHYIVYLSIILTIWDPWHFLMQHYGFVRIYDRHNQAPRKIATRMDYWICATWFIFCMVSATGWLPNLIYDFNHHLGIPLLFLLNSTVFTVLVTFSMVVAAAMTLGYAYYLFWCRKNGYYVSSVKVILLLVTFGVMYLTYVPNPLMQQWIPEWTFSMGFAVIGMVHVSQYLAIAWKYNRGLAQREGASRSVSFTRLFRSRGGLLGVVIVGYVLVCLLYGTVLTDFGKSFWFPFLGLGTGGFATGLLIVLGSTVFTSTLLHYYYDGFIWKLRHKENQQNLALDKGKENPEEAGFSWWKSSGALPAGRVLARQSLYFLFPMALLSGLFWMSIDDPVERYPIYGMRLSLDQSSGTPQQRKALYEDSMERVGVQLRIEEQMLAIRERAVTHCYMADLLFERAMCQTFWSKTEQGLPGSLGPADSVRLEQPLSNALEHYQKALELPPPYGHSEEAFLAAEISNGSKSMLDQDYIAVRMADIRKIQEMIESP